MISTFYKFRLHDCLALGPLLAFWFWTSNSAITIGFDKAAGQVTNGKRPNATYVSSQQFDYNSDPVGNCLLFNRDDDGGVGRLVAVKPRNGRVYFAVYDGNRNVVGLVDGSSGLISASYEYGPFGEPIRVTGPMGQANPFRFSTKYTDGTSGLIYYGYRYYNPDTGRWLSRDPLGESGGLNLYGFVGNVPTDSVDVLGLAVGDFWDPRTAWCRALGVAEGVRDQISGLYNVVRHPQQTMDNIVDVAYNYNEGIAALKASIKDAAKQYWDSKRGCDDPCIALRMEGKLASELLPGLATGGASLALKFADKAEDLSALAKINYASKTGDLLNEAVTRSPKAGGHPMGFLGRRKAEKKSTSIVYSGHGALYVDDATPITIIPQGTSLTFWVEHGEAMSDALGRRVDTGIPISLNKFPEATGARTYLPGAVVPNYTLHPPTPELVILGTPVTVTWQTPLSALLRPGMGMFNGLPAVWWNASNDS